MHLEAASYRPFETPRQEAIIAVKKVIEEASEAKSKKSIKNNQELKCQHCEKVCGSKPGLIMHEKSCIKTIKFFTKLYNINI